MKESISQGMPPWKNLRGRAKSFLMRCRLGQSERRAQLPGLAGEGTWKKSSYLETAIGLIWPTGI